MEGWPPRTSAVLYSENPQSWQCLCHWPLPFPYGLSCSSLPDKGMAMSGRSVDQQNVSRVHCCVLGLLIEISIDQQDVAEIFDGMFMPEVRSGETSALHRQLAKTSPKQGRPQVLGLSCQWREFQLIICSKYGFPFSRYFPVLLLLLPPSRGCLFHVPVSCLWDITIFVTLSFWVYEFYVFLIYLLETLKKYGENMTVWSLILAEVVAACRTCAFFSNYHCHAI